MATFTNPIIPGFHPDPSICRVGDNFYLVTSSFEYFPGLPLFTSTDLVNWRQIGHVLTRESQLQLRNAPASGGLYAPTIRYHEGIFYVTCTNVTNGGHFIVHTEDIEGEWSEPVWIDQNGIDPSLFFEDGNCYFSSTVEPAPGDAHALQPDFVRGAQQCLINPLTGEKLSESRFIWAGTGGMYPEAPHLYRRGDYYYLMLAEGGTHAGHMVTIARSDSAWGPWESCPHNPIVSHRSLPSPIQYTGHADLVELADGSWWAVALGTRPHANVHILGRETFLAPVTWDDDGWPHIGMIPEQGEGPDLPATVMTPARPADDFSGPEWNTLRRPLGPSEISFDGGLTLTGTSATTDDPLLTAWLRRQQHHAMRTEAVLNYEPTDGTEAGITIHSDERHHIDIAVVRKDGQRTALLRYRIGPLCQVLGSARLADGEIRLTITSTAESYTVAVGQDVLGTVPSRYLGAEVVHGFTGVYLGMYATGQVPARWLSFAYSEV